MANVSYKLKDLEKKKTIKIGYVGENNHMHVRIDCEEVFKEYPNAAVTMAITPPEGEDYPKVVTRDGNVVEWTVANSDVAAEGYGEFQMTFTEGEVIRKTVTASFEVIRSIVGNGTAPSGIDDFLTNANAKLAAVDEAIQDAEDAASHAPTIGNDGYWYRWDADQGEYVSTGTKAQGEQGDPGSPGDPTQLIDDTAGEGQTGKTWSADKLDEEITDVKTAIQGLAVTPEMFGAKGDGVTDDSQAVQDAVDAGYNIKFDDNKTYYLASPVTIDHDIHIYGGQNTVIKTQTPTGGVVNNAFIVEGTLKKTTTLTTDYTSIGCSDNGSNKFTLSDMTGINIGDLLIIEATDQFYSYARQYYYLGGVLRVSDVYGGHIYTDISLPFDIENTENVTVKIYEAPTAIFENIKFISDRESRGNYKFFVTLNYAKDCIVRNCDMTDMDNGLRIYMCHNTLVDNVRLSQSKYDNSLTGDGYGIMLSSSTNTVVQRITAICAQGCLALGGTIPVFNTFVYNCNLNSECRAIGIDMHENSYNLVVEDCTLGGLSLYGTVTVNRCRIIRNERTWSVNYFITVRGSHDPKWADFKITNCVFEGTGLSITCPVPQTAIQAFDNIIGSIKIENCKGGQIAFNPSTDETIISNTINRFIIKNWIDCKELYYTEGNIIKFLQIIDSTFTEPRFINKHSGAMYLDGILDFDYQSINPIAHKIHTSKTTRGCNYVLPKDVSIQLTSDNPSTAKYVVCGINTTPDVEDDYLVGTITGAVGSNLSRSIATAANRPTVSINENDGVVYSQNSGTGNYSLCTVGMLYVKEISTFSISAILKNTGETDGASFYPYIAIVDCETGKVIYRGNGTKRTASAEGVAISHSYTVPKNCVVIGYFYCTTAVANSVSTFEDLQILLSPLFTPAVIGDKAYTAKRMTGDGTIKSLEGVNNIMSYESTFNVKFDADMVNV